MRSVCAAAHPRTQEDEARQHFLLSSISRNYCSVNQTKGRNGTTEKGADKTEKKARGKTGGEKKGMTGRIVKKREVRGGGRLMEIKIDPLHGRDHRGTHGEGADR